MGSKNCNNRQAISVIFSIFLASAESLFMPVSANGDSNNICSGNPPEQLVEICEQILETQAQILLLQQQRELDQLRLGSVFPELTNASLPLSVTGAAGTTLSVAPEDAVEPMESTILAYEAIEEIAGYVYQSIERQKLLPDNSSLVLASDASIANSLAFYSIYQSQRADLENAFKLVLKIMEDPAPDPSLPSVPESTGSVGSTAALGFPTSLLRTAVEFLAFFRSKDDITVEEVDLNAGAFGSRLAFEFLTNQSSVDIYHPDLFMLDLVSSTRNNRASGGSNQDAFGVLGGIWNEMRPLFEYNAQAILKLNAEQAKKPGERDAKVISELEALTQRFEEFVKGLELLSSDAESAALYSLAQAASLEEILRKDNSYILFAQVIAEGGSNRTRNSLFTTIFTGNRISYSGGVVVNYSLFDRDGSIMFSDVVYHNTGFTRMQGERSNIQENLGRLER